MVRWRTYHHNCSPHPQHSQQSVQLDWELGITANTTKKVSTLFTLSTTKETVSLNLNNEPVPHVEMPTFLGVTLDTRLMWTPHLEVFEVKATRNLAIMKTLAGTTWGANSDILKQVYTRGCKTSRWVCLHNNNNKKYTQKSLKRKSFKHKLKDLQKENVDPLEADPGKCKELTTIVWALRKSLPEVRSGIPGLAAKGTQAPELQKVLTLEMR